MRQWICVLTLAALAGCSAQESADPTPTEFSFQVGNTTPSPISVRVDLTTVRDASAAIERSFDIPAHSKTMRENLTLPDNQVRVHAVAGNMEKTETITIGPTGASLAITLREDRIAIHLQTPPEDTTAGST